tara:strand:- start:76 stop:1074 length:999 start_codon:yes stop_codon:yes gene_type:complete
MKVEDTVFVVYDSMFKLSMGNDTLSPKKLTLYDFLDRQSTLVIFSRENFLNGLTIHELRASLLELKGSKKKIHPIVWNGTELGCRSFVEILNNLNFDQNLVFMENGVIPHKKYFRFMSKPIDIEKNWGFNTESVKWFKQLDEYKSEKLFDFAQEKLEEGRKPLTPFIEKQKPQKNKVCIVMQCSSDSTLYSLENPFLDYPKLIEKYLKDKYKSNFSNLQIIGCPHPSNPNDAYSYDMSAFKNIQASLKPTLAQCMDAELVIGYNSTTLLETHLRGVPTIALDPNHPLNFIKNEKDNKLLISRIKAAQFDPDTISYEDFLTQKATYLKLSKNT